MTTSPVARSRRRVGPSDLPVDRPHGPARSTGGSPRLRVVHVIDSLAGSGGAENRLVDEVIALTDRVEQTVVRLFERGELDARLADAGVPVLALGFRARRAGRSWPLIAARLRTTMRRLSPDVVHTSLFTGNLVGQLAAASLAVPVVSTFNRTGDPRLQRALQPGMASWKGSVMSAVGRWASRRGDVHYRAVGAYARETNCASLGLPLDRATVVPRGVGPIPAAPSHDRDRFGLPEHVPLVVNVARLVPEKGQHLLVEAFARVHAQVSDAHLAIAGAAGPAEPAVRAAIERHDLGAAVHLLGHRSDARELVAAADVFAFSSLSEGSPGAVVEAMAIGTPVAAFAIPPVAELTDDGAHAWLAPPESVDGLADAVLAALHAPDRAARVAATQEWAATRYSLDTVAGELADLLAQRVAASRARRVDT